MGDHVHPMGIRFHRGFRGQGIRAGGSVRVLTDGACYRVDALRFSSTGRMILCGPCIGSDHRSAAYYFGSGIGFRTRAKLYPTSLFYVQGQQSVLQQFSA